MKEVTNEYNLYKVTKMFNFTIFTKALTDTTLSKNEFRVLCLMLNTSSFKQSNTFEMYNGFIQDTLGISERNVRDITKSLELKDYIKKEVNTNPHNRNANTYTIIDAESCTENCPPNNITEKCAESCTEKCAENCPPNNIIKNKENNNKINKSKDNSIDIYDTGVTPGTKAKINKNENGDMDMMENATKGKVVKSENLTNSNDGIEQNKDNSSTGEMDMEIRNIDGLSSSGDTGENEVSEVSDNGTSVKNAENEVKRNDNKNITSTQRTGNNSSTDENDTSKTEALVAATMEKIEQLKQQMYDSRNSELNFNVFFDEFKRCMTVMKANTSTEAYDNYHAQIGKWWRKTKQYLPYRDEKITAAADAPHTDEVAERMKLDYAVESCIYERNTDKVQGGLMHIIKYFETHTDEKLAEEIIQKLNNHRHGNAILDSVLNKIGIICF